MKNLVQDRRDKLDSLRARGHEPFSRSGVPNDRFEFDITSIEKVRAAHDPAFTKETGPEFTVTGRVALSRGHGKLSFLTITGDDGQIQVAIDQSKFVGIPYKERWDWPQIQSLDLGDIVIVKGRLASTQRGEITIWADTVRITSKCLVPPPEKVNGLIDPELRYRNRHVDLWNPDVMKVLRQRSQIIHEIRTFMHDQGFSEVETPMMQPAAGGAIAKPFVTHHNALDIDLYLRIAPELYLKRLLVGGMKKIFEIGKNFRNEGISPRHNPEFTSMEAYEAFGDRDSMMALVENLICHVVQKVHGTLQIPYKDQVIDFSKFRTVTLQELVIHECGPRTPEGMQQVYEEEVEPTLVQPTFVLNMPASAVPLARHFKDGINQGYAEVFELVIGGMEIAPGYTELTDPDIQLQNLKAQAINGHIMDQDFVEVLKSGMPPAGGLGLGIDRLVAIITNQPSIRDVIAFPTMRPKV